MRAKTVDKPIAYCFDFDDTLVKTDAKIYVYKNNKKIKTLSPEEFNLYEQDPEETLDLSDFIDPRLILTAKKYKMWPTLENIYNHKTIGRLLVDIYILSARSSKAQLSIHNFLSRNKINIPLDNIITIGSDTGKDNDIPGDKERILRVLANEYNEVYFFDDSEKNIELANRVPGVTTKLVELNIK